MLTAGYFPPIYADFTRRSKGVLDDFGPINRFSASWSGRALDGCVMSAGLVKPIIPSLPSTAAPLTPPLSGQWRVQPPMKGLWSLDLLVDTGSLSFGSVSARRVVPQWGHFTIKADAMSSTTDFATQTHPLLTLTGVLTRPMYSATSVVTMNDSRPMTAAGSVSIGFDGFSLGGAAELDLVKKSLSDYKAGMHFQHGNSTFTLTSLELLNSLQGTIVHDINTQVQVGALVTKGLIDSKKFGGIVGVRFQPDPSLVLKCKVEVPEQRLTTTIEHRLTNPQVCVGLTNVLDWSKELGFAPAGFGFSLIFGDV